MAQEYRFKNAKGVEITTKDATKATDMRHDPRFSEVKAAPKKSDDKK